MIRNDGPFWDLVEREHKRARAYCLRLTLNPEEGDDLYMDSIMKAHRGFAQIKDVERFRPWLYQIINNNYIGRSRDSWWRRVFAGPIEGETFEPGSDPSGEYEAKRRLEFAFTALSADDRIIVTLAELDGWKISEIAQLTSKSEGTIKMRLSRARDKMRRRLSSVYRKSTAGNTDEGTEDLCYVIKPEQD